ncbi:membrane protein containing Diverse 7TM receptor, transmembrane region [Candidatus Magnetomorum sp. HK-1]|nr:membrane protein containing Diverse 7TM receptor, transmembrane region [Candidatus Magnetomorum sp. HK-1]
MISIIYKHSVTIFNINTLTKKTVIFIILQLFLPLCVAIAQKPFQELEIFDHTGKYLLGQHVRYIEDVDKKWSIDDILTKSFENNFLPGNAEKLNFGYSNSAFWVLCDLNYSIQNKNEKEWLLEIAYPLLDKIELFIKENNEEIIYKISGSKYPFRKKELQYNNVVFRLKLKPGLKTRFYLRVQSESSLQIPLILWEKKEFTQMIIIKEYCFGLFIGTILIMILYNLIVYISIKDKNFLYYINFICSLVFSEYAINGSSSKILANYTLLNMGGLIPFLLCYLCMSGLFFTKAFLKTKEYLSKMDVFISFNILVGFIILLFTIAYDYSNAIKFSIIYTIIFSLTSITCGIISYIKGNKSARFYIFAFFSIKSGIICFSLKCFGYIPANIFTEYSHHVGSLLLAFFLSIALIDRINIERKISKNSQKLTLKEQKKLLIMQKKALESNKETARKLEIDSNKLAEISKSFAESIEMITNETECVAGTSEEMTYSIRSIAFSIENMRISLENISRSAQKFLLNIDSVVTAVDLLSAAMVEIEKLAHFGSKLSEQSNLMSKKTTETMSELDIAASEIDKVTDVIKRISDKTNLLALNAAIEAVEAGDAGKGFAVVANSIQKFADQSSFAAEDIAKRISDVQFKTKDAIDVIKNISQIIDAISVSSEKITVSIEEQTQIINDIALNTNEASASATEISKLIDELLEGINDISINASEMTKGSDDVSKNIRSVSQEMIKSKEEMTQIKKSSNNLSQMAKSLCLCFMILFIFPFLNKNVEAKINLKIQPVEINDEKGQYDLGYYVHYLEDETQQLSIDDLISNKHEKSFIQSNEKNINFGFSKSIYWIVWDLKYIPPHQCKKEWLLEISYPQLDQIELFIVKADGNIQKKIAGDLFPFHQRELAYRNFVFQLNIKPDEILRLFLRVKTESSVQVPLRLWTYETFTEYLIQTEYYFGLYMGTFLIIILYNIFVYISIKNINILNYIHFIMSWLFFQTILNGHAYQYLWNNSPWWTNKILPFSMIYASITGIIFAKKFIEIRKYDIKADNVLNGFILFGICFMPLTLIINYSFIIKISTSFTLIWALSLVYTGISVYLKGNKTACFYLVAWISILLGIISYSLKTIGIFPANFFTEYSVQIGSIILVLFLSMAMVDRINLERKRNEKHREKMLKEQNKLLNNQKITKKSQEKTAKQLEIDIEKLANVSVGLANNIEKVTHEAESVAGTSEQMSYNIRCIAESIENMSLNVQNISQSASQLFSNINFVTLSIDMMSNGMSGVEKYARKGSDIAKQANVLSQKTTKTMSELDEAANEIGKVTDVIKRISDKTNLLALNAAIEAAAAGNSGRGFAVVANSIQKFADQSAFAARDIAKRISEVQVKSKLAISVIHDISTYINEINTMSEKIAISVEEQTKTATNIVSGADDANEIANQISASINDVSSGAFDISYNASEISKGADNVFQNMSSVTKEIIKSKESIIQINVSSMELSDLSKELCLSI